MLVIRHAPQLAKLMDPATGHEFASLLAPEIDTLTCLTFSPDSGLVAVGTANDRVRVWDLRRIRAQLAEMGLDWESAKLPPPSADPPRSPLTIEVVPQDPATQVARAQQAQGDRHRALHQYAEAIACYRDVIKAEPNNATILNRLSWMLVIGPAEVRDAAEAVQLAERACALSPADPYFLGGLGAAQYRADKFAEALRTLEKVADATPNNFPSRTDNLLLQALCHQKLGNKPSAEAAYGKALELLKQADDDSVHWREARLLQKEVESLLAIKDADD